VAPPRRFASTRGPPAGKTPSVTTGWSHLQHHTHTHPPDLVSYISVDDVHGCARPIDRSIITGSSLLAPSFLFLFLSLSLSLSLSLFLFLSLFFVLALSLYFFSENYCSNHEQSLRARNEERKKREEKNRYKGTEDGKSVTVEFARECG